MTNRFGASVKGRLFIDADGDNTEWNKATHQWEAGFKGATIKLVNAHGLVVAEKITDGHGWYEFKGVPAGEYRVLFPKPEGYSFAQRDVGHWGSDSDADDKGFTVSFKVRPGDRICEIDAGLQPLPPADDCAVTETLLHETFNGLRKPEQSDAVAGHTNWKIVNGAAFSNGHADGALAFTPVALNGHHASLFQFDIKANAVENFEGAGHLADSIRVQIRVDGGRWVTIDTLRRDGHSDEFVGDQSGQRFGDDGYTTLTYLNENLPSGARSVEFRIVSHITAGDEKIFVDNVKIAADKKTCDDCPDGAVKIDFNDLEKGTIVSDQFEGVKITAIANGASRKIVVEAEHMKDWGFDRAHGSKASGGAFEKLRGHEGKLTDNFGGPTGKYDVTIRVQDENDGQSKLWLVVGHDVREIVLDRDNNGRGSDNGGFSDFTLKNVHIAHGQHYYIFARRDGGETVRIDKLTFESTAPTGNRAMIFDTDHITGGDHDLAKGDRKVLIISEDGDSSDPDDNAQGGQFHLDFDAPSDVTSFTLIDSEEGGTVVALDADGNQIGDVIDLPKLADGSVATITVDRDGVSKLVITLNGSGAIDDLCFKPVQEPEPGSLSGRYFCDTNDNDVDDGQAVDPGEAGVLVELLDAAGDGTGITTTTDATGNYSFNGLRPGTYGVRFTDPAGVLAGKVLVTPNVGDDDAVDSDAIGDVALSVILGITVVSGRDTPDNDAGAEKLNRPPTADDETAKLCANTALAIDVLNGDVDAEGDPLFVTAVNGQAIAEGGSVTLASGAVVRLVGGELVYDLTGADAFDTLLVGAQASDSFVYTVSDGALTAEGAVDVTVCGDFDTVGSISAELGQVGLVTARLQEDLTVGGGIYGVDILSVEFPDSRLGEVLAELGQTTIELAFCLAIAAPIAPAPVSHEFTISVLDADSYAAAVADTTRLPAADFGFNPQNADNVNWLLNEAEALLAEGFSEGSIQRAIWNLLDGGADSVLNGSIANNYFAARPWFGDFDDAFELTRRALDNDGFVAGAGDIVGLVLDPVVDGVQPLVIGVAFDDLAANCLCESMFV